MTDALGAVLAAFTLLVTTKLTVDVASADPPALNEATGILLLGSLLAAYLVVTY
jgi:hypothetical protein